MQMLCEILDATETNVLHVSSAVHSIYVISLLLLQGQIQLVRRHVDEVSISPDCRLHLHEDFLRAPVVGEGQLEVARAAALSFLVKPGDLARAAVLFPVWEEGVDQLLSPLSDAGRVVFVFRQHQGLRHGAIQRQVLQHVLQSHGFAPDGAVQSHGWTLQAFSSLELAQHYLWSLGWILASGKKKWNHFKIIRHATHIFNPITYMMSIINCISILAKKIPPDFFFVWK